MVWDLLKLLNQSVERMDATILMKILWKKIIKQLIGEDCFNKAKNAICKDRYNEWISLEKKNRRIEKKF